MWNQQMKQPYYGLINMMKIKHLTQKEAANIIGISTSTFNLKINRRNGRDFKLDEAKKIAEELKISAEEF